MSYPVLFITKLNAYSTDNANVSVSQVVHNFESRLQVLDAITQLEQWAEQDRSQRGGVTTIAIKLYRE